MKRFPGKRVYITGAGSGFGRALALEFAGMGWKVAIADINEERANETKALVDKAGGQGLVIVADATRQREVEKSAKAVCGAFGGVDIVVNNAGVAGAGRIEAMPLSQWNWIIDLNLKTVILGCRTFVPILEKQGGGHIVNMASNAGIASLPEMSCYNVTKAAVISLSETLRVELAKKKIGVTVVAPTFFKTNLMDQFRSTDASQRAMAEKFFSKSMASAEEVAHHALVCVRKNRLYSICQKDGKFVWYMKRLAPETYFNVMRFCYGRGIFDRLMGAEGH